jgi:hypothetical protein
MSKYQCWNCGADTDLTNSQSAQCNACGKPIPPDRMFTAYLLDVTCQTLRPVSINRQNSLDTIYSLIGCRHVDAVRLDDTHVAYCDDAGLLQDDLSCFTTIAGLPHPLAGNLVFVGTNAHGDDCTPSLSLADLQSRLIITRGVFTPVLENIQTGDAIGVQLRGLTLRAVTSAPAIPA